MTRPVRNDQGWNFIEYGRLPGITTVVGALAAVAAPGLKVADYCSDTEALLPAGD